MRYPFMVSWIGEDCKQHSSSFKTEGRRDRIAQALLERGLQVWVGDQLQLDTESATLVQQTYGPGDDIPF